MGDCFTNLDLRLDCLEIYEIHVFSFQTCFHHIELCTTRPLKDTKNKHNDRSDPRCLMLCR